MKDWGRALPGAVAAAMSVCGIAWSQTMLDELQPEALKVAQARGTEELGCPAGSAQVVKREVVEGAATTGWSDIPRRADYTVAVSGCGQQKIYLVTCDRWEKGCAAGAPPRAVAAKPTRLADQLEPDAIQSARLRGITELDCPAAAAKVLRKETIEEGQTTGWYDPPHRALFRIDVSGCGQSKRYVVSCNSRASGGEPCNAVAFQQAPKHSVRQLADELQPAALAAAQRRGASDLSCAAAVASVLRKETIEEPQTTGWYEPPYRALYQMEVTGCGQRTTYVVACDKLRTEVCKAGTITEAAR